MGGHGEEGGRDGGGDGVVGVHTLSVAIGHQGGEDAEADVRDKVIGGAQAGICDVRGVGGGGNDGLGAERAVVGGVYASVGGAIGRGAEAMLSLSPTTRVYLRAGATDLRGGFERLYQLARTGFGQDPLAGGQVFAFCNERRTRVKLLFHDSSGLWICTKRPDRGTFAWVDEAPVDPLTAAQLWALVSGLEVRGWRRAWRRPEKDRGFPKKDLASA